MTYDIKPGCDLDFEWHYCCGGHFEYEIKSNNFVGNTFLQTFFGKTMGPYELIFLKIVCPKLCLGWVFFGVETKEILYFPWLIKAHSIVGK